MAVPTLWRTKQQRYSLIGEKCPSCTNAMFPPRKVCPHCGQPMVAMSVEAMTAPVQRFSFRLPYPMTHYVERVAGDD